MVSVMQLEETVDFYKVLGPTSTASGDCVRPSLPARNIAKLF